MPGYALAVRHNICARRADRSVKGYLFEQPRINLRALSARADKELVPVSLGGLQRLERRIRELALKVDKCPVYIKKNILCLHAFPPKAFLL